MNEYKNILCGKNIDRHNVLIKEMAREEKEFAEAQAHEEQLQALENEMDLMGESQLVGDDTQEDFQVIDDDNFKEENLPAEKIREPISEATRREKEVQDEMMKTESQQNTNISLDVSSAGAPKEPHDDIEKGNSAADLPPVGDAENDGDVAPAQASSVVVQASEEEATAPKQQAVGHGDRAEDAGGNQPSERHLIETRGIQAPLLPDQNLTKDQLVLQRHQKRLQELIDKEKEDKRIEQILSRDKFLDVLASKLSEKMSVQASLTASPIRGPGNADLTREPWHPGITLVALMTFRNLHVFARRFHVWHLALTASPHFSFERSGESLGFD